MIVSKLALTTLIFVASGPFVEPSGSKFQQLSLQQKNTLMLPYLRAATECISRVVASDPRFGSEGSSVTLSDLIVDSMPKCIEPARALVDAYDRNYGKGAGEAFFMGPYLDVLPTAVRKLTAN